MEVEKVIGLIISILCIFILAIILNFCLKCNKIIKIYPENNNIVSV